LTTVKQRNIVSQSPQSPSNSNARRAGFNADRNFAFLEPGLNVRVNVGGRSFCDKTI